MSLINKVDYYNQIPLTKYKLFNKPIGLSSTPGPKGRSGPTGPTGPAGFDGAAGPTGQTGPTGYIGYTGPSGITGSSELVKSNIIIQTNTVNIDIQTTKVKKQLKYTEDKVIRESDIIAKINGVSKYGKQVYTFGPNIPQKYIATVFDNYILYSNDSINWNAINTLTTGNNGIAYNGNIWLRSTYDSANVYYSYDGIIWTFCDSANNLIDSTNYAIKWNGILWILGGYAISPSTNTLAYSYDGINWTSVNWLNNPTIDDYCNSVIWNGQKWVACGQGTAELAVSSDGINWSSIQINTLNGSYPIDNIYNLFGSNGVGGIGWNGSLWIATGDSYDIGYSIAYSYDTINWTYSDVGSLIFNFYNNAGGIAWNGNIWVVCGGVNYQLAYSYNGIDWTGIKIPDYADIYSVIYDGNKFIAVGSGPIIFSYDGINWSTNNSVSYIGGVALNNIRPNTITFPQNIIVATNISGGSITESINTSYIFYSYDAITWNLANSSNDIFDYSVGDIINCVAFNGKMWIAGGLGTYKLAYSYDGINWFAATGYAGVTTINAIIWDSQKWIAIGSSTICQIIYSYDGISWFYVPNNSNNLFLTNALCIQHNDSIYLAGGRTNGTTNSSIAYSYDGINNWTPINGTGSLLDYCHAIVWNGYIWVAVGIPLSSAPSKYTIIYSYDGINWIPVSNSFTIFPSDCLCVAWNGYRWVVGGSGGSGGVFCLAWSDNGIVWNGVSGSASELTICQSIEWTGNLWTASASNGTYNYATSPNGVNWTYYNLTSSFNYFSSIAQDKSLPSVNIKQPIIVGGSGNNTMAYSFDGIIWNPLDSSLFASLSRVFYGSSIWVAVGSNPSNKNIAYSYDGIKWFNDTIITNGTILFPLTDVAYNGSLWIAVGDIGNRILTSLDGINWTIQNNIGSLADSYKTIAFNGYYWTIGGSTIRYSFDAITWTPSTITGLTPIPTININKIIWTGSSWLAISTNYLLSASFVPDIWTNSATTNLTAIKNNQSLLTFGYSSGTSIKYSNLSPISLNNSTSSLTSCSDIAWNGTVWIAVGSGLNPINYSYDGIIWYDSLNGSNLFTSCNSVSAISNIYQFPLDKQLILKKNQTLDIISDDYYNTGFSNASFSITSTTL